MSAIIDFFKEHYFWILFFLISLIAILIYSKLDLSSKARLKKLFSGKVLVAIIFILGWILWAKEGQINEIKDAHRWMPIIGLALIAGYNFVGGLRYESQQLHCANGLHFSYAKPPIRVNGFLIFAGDSFCAGSFEWRYAKRIIVLREETVQFTDEGAVTIARPAPTNTWAYDLEAEVKERIENDKYLKGRNKIVYYGWFDDLEIIDYSIEKLAELEELDKDDSTVYAKLKKEFGVDNPKISKLYWLYRNQCKATNKQTEQYDATIEAVEKGVEHHKRVKDAYIEKQDKSQQLDTGGEEY